ncbi:YchJ family protein [Embleya sp. NPDC008237]|uniref:YchJ family protein n=1 Tax=Embleya sp. NPDC008237 TaxID=3363978 RepID=UPI0036E66104
MSRRTPRPRSEAVVTAGSPCPCGLPDTYGACCGARHAGSPAPTAEALMRSRYSAFAVRDTAYLLRTWHPDTRPERLDSDEHTRWLGLEVLASTGGGPFHQEGTVEFIATYREHGHRDTLREHSRFVRHDGAWVYVGPLPR